MLAAAPRDPGSCQRAERRRRAARARGGDAGHRRDSEGTVHLVHRQQAGVRARATTSTSRRWRTARRVNAASRWTRRSRAPTRVKAFTFADIDRAIQYSYVIEPAMDDAYRMVAAHAAGVAPNLGAAVYARLLISRQNRDGDWDGFHQRPPSSYSRFTMAALGLRAVQLYHHPSQKAAAAAAVARARTFLETQQARATEEHAYRIIGLKWAGADRDTLQRLARELKAAQRAGRRVGRVRRTRQRRLRDRAGAGGAARGRRRRHRSGMAPRRRVSVEGAGRRRFVAPASRG